MGLETATYINGLVASNPVGASDPKSQGDDHIRLLKATILATFPNITGAVTVTHGNLNGILDASNLTAGTLPDARLSTNVPLKNAANVLSGNTLELNGNNPQYRFRQNDAAVDGKDWYFVADGPGFYLVATSDGFTVPVLIPLVVTRNLVASITSVAWLTDSFTVNGTEVWRAGNDGAASGLDADLLDGQHGAFYQNAGNLNAGTLPDARFPATLPAASGANLTALNAANVSSGTLAIARGGTGQTTQVGITREVTKAWTIASDPGGTPSGTAGDVFAYY